MLRSRWILATAVLCGSTALAATPPQQSPHKPSGVDMAGIDHGVKPGDDFFRYANGDWLKTAKIPADRSSTGTFLKVFEQSEKDTAELIRNAGVGHPAAGSNARKIADYYAAWMNTATIEKHGLAPLKTELAQIDAIASREDLARVLGSRLRADVDPINATNYHTQNLFGLFVTQGLEDPSHHIAYLLQGGIGLPSRDYYLSSDPHMVEARGKYLTYVGALLQQAGIADAQAKAKTIVALETKIAKAQASLIDSEDVHKANNLWRMDEFAQKAPGLDWASYFKAAGLQDQARIDAWQAGAISGLSALTASEPLQAWKDLLTFHTINHAAGLLPKAYADLNFNFYVRTLQGTPVQQPRWKRAVGSTSNDLGDAVGQLYVKHYFPASSKAEIEQLVKNLIAAFNDRIDTLSWMTPATRAKAKAKLDTLRVGVGYPDTWRDYATLEIRADDALGNRLRAEKFEYEHQRAKLGQSVDKGEWWMTPQTVNAVNLPLQNALNFPAAILQPPFFDPKADAAANYGSIGAIIGHEISHSFDNLGAEFDAQGRLANWWTPEDLAHFKATGQQLIDQFNQYEALPGLHVDGKQTLGENIADVSGLTIAYLAYHKSLGDKPAPVIDGLTGDQRFFLAFGQAWRGKIRDAALRQRLSTDVHAPGDFRALTVRNLDQWYPAFEVKQGQKLYLDPKDRVKIW
ncbi:M13 family metallopeptidase [Rhodanobacter sp. Col0626]|uniref:M13 family metallopeptidase n=1 Tax=Rhodanobacter sp. Col0626 TaxID=3415679 RepID=UPI003CF225A8